MSVSATLPPLADRDVRRIIATAALLRSDKDGEALAATRGLCRLFDRNGLDFGTVIEAGLGRHDPPRPAYSRVQPRGPAPVAPLRPHQRQAWQCLAYPELLNDWERQFLRNLTEARSVSDKQRGRLNAIAASVERGRK